MTQRTIYGNITGSKAVMNWISYELALADEYRKLKGLNPHSYASEVAEKIYENLKEEGYYNT